MHVCDADGAGPYRPNALHTTMSCCAAHATGHKQARRQLLASNGSKAGPPKVIPCAPECADRHAGQGVEERLGNAHQHSDAAAKNGDCKIVHGDGGRWAGSWTALAQCPHTNAAAWGLQPVCGERGAYGRELKSACVMPTSMPLKVR